MQIRKIPFILLLVLIALSAVAVANASTKKPPVFKAPPRTPSSLGNASATQKGRSLVLVADSTRPINLSRLSRFPSQNPKTARYLCFRITPGAGRGVKRLCLGGPKKPLVGAGLTIANAAGRAISTRTVEAVVKRPSPTRLVVTVAPKALGLAPGGYDWQLTSRFDGPLCPARISARGCSPTFPAAGKWRQVEVKRVRTVGCTTGSAGLVTRGIVTRGPDGRKLVALTFDDGPSSYTDGFLRVLRQKGVRGTFFVLGQLTAAYPDLARRIVNEGHEIASHSWKHDLYPSASDLRQTSATIQSVTGFRPCSFRPPGGARNASVIAGAGQSGMKTIIWDVDPFDWRLPGTDAIRRIVVSGTRPGSIVLTHDGGGPRSQTLAALPRIIDELRGRGYSFTTVTEILGGRFLYRAG